MKQNLDNVVNSSIRSLVEISVSGTLDIVTLLYKKYGLNIHKLSTKFMQCQVTFRLCLRNSTNADIRRIYNKTSKDKNVQYDTYKNTRKVIKNIRLETKDRIENELTTQKLVIKSIWNQADNHSSIYWRKTINRLPKNIYNFVIRYLNGNLEPIYIVTFVMRDKLLDILWVVVRYSYEKNDTPGDTILYY